MSTLNYNPEIGPPFPSSQPTYRPSCPCYKVSCLITGRGSVIITGDITLVPGYYLQLEMVGEQEKWGGKQCEDVERDKQIKCTGKAQLLSPQLDSFDFTGH